MSYQVAFLVKLLISMRHRVIASLSVVTLLALAAVLHSGSAGAAGGEASHYAYRLVILSSLGGTTSYGNGVIDEGWIAGSSYLANNTAYHATLWTLNPKRTIDVGTLGGPNSFFYAATADRGQFPGNSDTSTMDPLGENFCYFNSGHICEGMLWQMGSSLSPLPPLAGGNNDEALDVNDLGQAAGVSENSTHDSSCHRPQILDYEPVIWQPTGQITQLPLVQGDQVGVVGAINDLGNAVGNTGSCLKPSIHATLWQNGKIIALPTLGGTYNNTVIAMNARGEMAGSSDVKNDTAYHATLWKTAKSVTDLGVLPGDLNSASEAINNEGQIAGVSYSATASRAFLWRNGKIYDLNTLIPPNSGYSLIVGFGSSDSGIIVGQAYNAQTGDVAAFAAIPSGYAIERARSNAVPPVTLPPTVMKQLMNHVLKRPGAPAAF